jgi:hypothetical protein
MEIPTENTMENGGKQNPKMGFKSQVHDEVVKYLCQELTSTETVFPCTDLRLIYEIAGSG